MLHETTQRRVCQAAFLLLGVAPSLATAAWIVDRRLPGRAAEVAAAWSAALQVDARLNAVREPRPGAVACADAALAVARDAPPGVQFAALRVYRRGAAWILSAESATLAVDQAPALIAPVAAWVQAPGVERVDVRVGRVLLASPPSSAHPPWQLGELRLQLDRDPAGRVRCRAAVHDVDSPADARAALELVLHHTRAGERRVALEFARPSPVAWLAAWAPGAGSLNPEAKFVGAMEWTGPREGPVAGAAHGRLSRIDLASLLPAGSPHRLAGGAELAIADARWTGERLDRCEASLTASAVQASESLLVAAQKHLFCQPGPLAPAATADAASLAAIDQLACRVTLASRGLTLWGDLPQSAAAPAGCLAARGGKPVLLEPPYVDIPLGAWIQFAAGPAASWLPASSAAVNLARRLPME